MLHTKSRSSYADDVFCLLFCVFCKLFEQIKDDGDNEEVQYPCITPDDVADCCILPRPHAGESVSL